MATEFNDEAHFGIFTTNTTLTSGTGKYVRQSELTLAALRAAGVLDRMVDDINPPESTALLWLDKNFDPAVLKIYDADDAVWRKIKFTDLFGGVSYHAASLIDNDSSLPGETIKDALDLLSRGYVYPSLAFAQSVNIPATSANFFISEREVGKGGGGWWEYVGSTNPTEVPTYCKAQDAGGKWFKLSTRLNPHLTPEMCGAFGGVVIEAATRAIFNAMTTKPLAGPGSHLELIDETYRLARRYDLWGDYVVCYVPAAHNETDGFLDWKTPATKKLSKVGTTLFTAGVGAGGNDVDSYLIGDTAFTSLGAQNNIHIGAWVSEASTDDSPLIGTSDVDAPDAYIIPARASSAVMRSRLNDATSSDSTTAITDPVGYNCLSRGVPGSYTQSKEDVPVGEISVSSTGMPTGFLTIGKDGGSAGYANGKVGVLHAGTKLSRVKQDRSREVWGRYMRQIGTAITSGRTITAAELDAVAAINATVTTAALQACFNHAGGRCKVRLGPVTYVVNTTIRVPSHSNIEGLGRASRIRMAGTVGRGYTVVKSGQENDKRKDIHLDNFWVDFNLDRDNIASGPTTGSSGSALVICNTDGGSIRRMYGTDGYKHSIDISGAGDHRTGTDGTPPPYTSHDRCEYIFAEDCLGEGAGDDCFTTHDIDDSWLVRCGGINSRGTYTVNSNGVEVDDGSRRVTVIDCYASRCQTGLQIKGHADANAAREISVRGFRIDRCSTGLELLHQSFGGDPGENASPSAFDLTISGIEVRRMLMTHAEDLRPIRLLSYNGLLLSDLVVTDDNSDRLAPFFDDTVCEIHQRARNVHIRGMTIRGFDWAEITHSVRVEGTTKGGILSMSGLNILAGATNGVFLTGDVGDRSKVFIDNYYISGSGTTGIYDSTGTAKVTIGGGLVSGYTNWATLEGVDYSVATYPQGIRTTYEHILT